MSDALADVALVDYFNAIASAAHFTPGYAALWQKCARLYGWRIVPRRKLLDAEAVAVPERAGAALRITLEDMLADIEKYQKARDGTG